MAAGEHKVTSYVESWGQMLLPKPLCSQEEGARYHGELKETREMYMVEAFEKSEPEEQQCFWHQA